MFYLMFVLKQSGVTSDLGQDLALIGLGTVKLVFVFVGARNFDKVGRRPMLFLSLGGMAVSLVVVSVTFTNSSSDTMKSMTVVALAVYLAFFSIGLGPGNWVVVSEIFAPSIRAKAMMLAVLPNRLTATFMASTFLSVAHAITWPGFFLLLAGICLASMVFLFLYLPETKGKSLEDMVGYFAEVTGDRSILDLENKLRNSKEEFELEMGGRTTSTTSATGSAATIPPLDGLDCRSTSQLQVEGDDDDDDDDDDDGTLDQTVRIS
jgi:MFS family permease